MSKSIRLKSTVGINTQGVLKWARQAYQHAMEVNAPVGVFIAVFADGYHLGPVLAEKLLRGEIEAARAGDEDVDLVLSEDDFRNFQCRTASLARGDQVSVCELLAF